jgi:hypothetical protein
MAYAQPADLAMALEMTGTLTPEVTALLQSCLDAAALEIDHLLGWQNGPLYVDPRISPDPITPPPIPELVVRTNVNRAVEWYKAPATYNGGVGTQETGNLTPPSSGFERHAAALLPVRTTWGLA